MGASRHAVTNKARQTTDSYTAIDRGRILRAIQERRQAAGAPPLQQMTRDEKIRRTHETVLRHEIEWGETLASLRRDPLFTRLMASEDWQKLESLRLETKSELYIAMQPYRDRLLEELDADEQEAAAKCRSRFAKEIEAIEAEMAKQLRACLPEGERRVITEDEIKSVLSQPNPEDEVRRQVVLDLGDATDPPVVLGVKQKTRLTDARRNVLDALLQAGPNGLSKDQLDVRSGHTESRAILRRLARSSAEWGEIIRLPGEARDGYRLRKDCWPPTSAH